MDLEHLCPINDRRTARELMVKFIIAHFTAVAAFCNYLSLRNQELASIEPILFLFCPLIVPLQISLGFLLITGVCIANIVTGRSSLGHEWSTYTRRLTTLLGKKAIRNASPGLARSPTGSLESGGAGQVAGSRLAKVYVTTGRLLLVLGTLFQCVATIFLYARRVGERGWESLSAIDFRTFELAIGGAAVSVLSAALLINFPGFGQATQGVSGGHIDAALPLFAGDPQRSCRWWFLGYSEKHGLWTCIIPIYALCNLVCMSSGTPVVTQRSHWIFLEVFLKESLLISRFVFIPGILGVILATYAWIKGRTSPKTNPRVGLKKFFEFLMLPSVSYLGFTLLMPFYMSFALVVVGSAFEVLWVKGFEAYHVWSEFEFAASADEAHVCPTLWKDPVSEYLWSLM
ncbi:hypothetical protein LCI18_012379 [Fusarium solani-melongenae]|uniref:Uncharacterized protein n=1 Tax=Fusarium solani subsp. cucurbitae TaxID=2747967 RepID=A0ACD3ZJH2_FUSSC|nr:hypothetical protein LCI18_012379 [Fusarium solani-melongenae]